MIKPSTVIVSILAFLTTAGFLIAGVLKLKDGIEDEVRAKAESIQTAETVLNLKAKWEDKNKIKGAIAIFASHPRISKNEPKDSRHTLEFTNLNPDEMNELTTKLMNSEFVIRKLEIKRLDATHGSILVEFDI